MSLIQNNNFHSIPSDARREIFSYLPARELFSTIPYVCKLFKNDLTNEFFKRKCFELFRSLESIPQFYDPIIQTVDNPWKVICYSLACISFNGFLDPIAHRLAKASLNKFKSYLSPVRDEAQSRMIKSRETLKSICGDYCQDPNSKIDKAWKSYEAFKAQAEKEINDTESIDEHSSAYARQMAKEFHIQANINIRILLRDRVRAEYYQSVALFLRQKNVDPRIVRSIELESQGLLLRADYDDLETERKNLDAEIKHLEEVAGHYHTIINDQVMLEKFSTRAIFHILYLLPHFKIWMPLSSNLEKLNLLLQQTPRPESSISYIQAIINSLPTPFPGTIWRELYDRRGNHIQEWQWAENHFHEYLGELSLILEPFINNCARRYGELNANPIRNAQFLMSFISHHNFTFNYPLICPDLEVEKEIFDRVKNCHLSCYL